MSVTVICQMCGKEIQAGNKGRMYCPDCVKERSRMSTIVRRENRQKQRDAQKFLPKTSAYKSPLDIMLCEIADYNLHQRLSGKPELSYGQYVAKFDAAQKEYHL